MVVLLELRILQPATVDEFERGQIFGNMRVTDLIAKPGSGQGSSVLLASTPYYDEVYGEGVFNHSCVHIGQGHVPPWALKLLPASALVLDEKTWQSYPYARTVLTIPFFSKMKIEMLTTHVDDRGDTPNALRLPKEDLAIRKVEHLDIATDPVEAKLYREDMDPSLVASKLTGRGPLTPGWQQRTEPMMCAYKTIKAEFGYWGLSSRVENLLVNMTRNLFSLGHKAAYCTMDEWYPLTLLKVLELLQQQRAASGSHGSSLYVSRNIRFGDEDDDEEEEGEVEDSKEKGMEQEEDKRKTDHDKTNSGVFRDDEVVPAAARIGDGGAGVGREGDLKVGHYGRPQEDSAESPALGGVGLARAAEESSVGDAEASGKEEEQGDEDGEEDEEGDEKFFSFRSAQAHWAAEEQVLAHHQLLASSGARSSGALAPSDAICPRCVQLGKEHPLPTDIYCLRCEEVFCASCFSEVHLTPRMQRHPKETIEGHPIARAASLRSAPSSRSLSRSHSHSQGRSVGHLTTSFSGKLTVVCMEPLAPKVASSAPATDGDTPAPASALASGSVPATSPGRAIPSIPEEEDEDELEAALSWDLVQDPPLNIFSAWAQRNRRHARTGNANVRGRDGGDSDWDCLGWEALLAQSSPGASLGYTQGTPRDGAAAGPGERRTEAGAGHTQGTLGAVRAAGMGGPTAEAGPGRAQDSLGAGGAAGVEEGALEEGRNPLVDLSADILLCLMALYRDSPKISEHPREDPKARERRQRQREKQREIVRAQAEKARRKKAATGTGALKGLLGHLKFVSAEGDSQHLARMLGPASGLQREGQALALPAPESGAGTATSSGESTPNTASAPSNRPQGSLAASLSAGGTARAGAGVGGNRNTDAHPYTPHPLSHSDTLPSLHRSPPVGVLVKPQPCASCLQEWAPQDPYEVGLEGSQAEACSEVYSLAASITHWPIPHIPTPQDVTATGAEAEAGSGAGAGATAGPGAGAGAEAGTGRGPGAGSVPVAGAASASGAGAGAGPGAGAGAQAGSGQEVSKKVLEQVQRLCTLLEQLVDADPEELQEHDDKLAFWVNVYNALVMHARLVYPPPRSEARRAVLLQKAAYLVGGFRCSAAAIERDILRPWAKRGLARALPSPSLAAGNFSEQWQLAHHEPLLPFALSHAAFSSPALRVLRPGRGRGSSQLLQQCAVEYLLATVCVKGQRTLAVPDIWYEHRREFGKSKRAQVEWLLQHMPSLDMAALPAAKGPGAVSLQVVPADLTFRYVLLDDDNRQEPRDMGNVAIDV